MADAPFGVSPRAAPIGTAVERSRTFAIVIYVLYLLAAPSVLSTMLVGVVIAYLKRGEARGTAFESHFANAIDMFWVALVVGIVALPLWPLFFLGAVIHAILFAWVVYRTIRGLIRAIEWQPY